MRIILGIISAYLLGSIPTGFLVAKAVKGIDIRKEGSGNIGATNVFRVIGKKWGILVLVLDILKGLLSVTILSAILYEEGLAFNLIDFKLLLGSCAICGHNWTIFLNFNGGKGIATGIGVIFGLLPLAGVIFLVIWIITVFATKYVALGSIISHLLLPLIIAVLGYDIKYVAFTIILCIISTYRHKDNIKRLLRGKENKI